MKNKGILILQSDFISEIQYQRCLWGHDYWQTWYGPKLISVQSHCLIFHTPGVEQTRVHTLEETSAILDIFQEHGHKEIDTARYYGQGSSEEYLGQLDWQKRGLVINTKFYPTVGRNMPSDQWSHKLEYLRENLMRSLKVLQAEKIDMWYLHGPDRTTPFEETLREVDKLHKKCYFTRFALRNHMAWEVAQICELCGRYG
jgi:aflatoxin B1 aldehyde reductase